MPFLTACAERLVEALELLDVEADVAVRLVVFARAALLGAAGRRVFALLAGVVWAVAIWRESPLWGAHLFWSVRL